MWNKEQFIEIIFVQRENKSVEGCVLGLFSIIFIFIFCAFSIVLLATVLNLPDAVILY
jgi:hypothetical protein